MKKLLAIFLSVLLLTACLPLGAISVSAARYGDLTYTVSGGEVTITDCSSYAFGALTIPSTINGYPVTTIGDDAFSYCDHLTSVTIPDSVTTIGNRAFFSCTSLTSVTIPDSVTTIGYRAFSDCDSLTSVTIPDSVTTIGDGAFSWCSSLTSVTIPDSVTTIGEYAFDDCTSLTSIQVDENNPNYCDIDGVLFNKSKTTLVQYPGGRHGAYAIPSTINGYPVTTIGKYAFSYCDSLTSVTIPDSVTTIGNRAFFSCTSLTSVTIPDSVTTIEDEAFRFCTSLTDVYYIGSETDRANIAIGSNNTALTNATWHYNACNHVYDDKYDDTCNECGEVREVPIHYGDLNGDGGVNARDLVLLQQYMAGWDVTFILAAADVDGDDRVVARDLALLQQYVAGWNVTLG